jgi:hypothetical protein
MVNTYQLVNPYISGTFKSKLKAKNSLEAANMFYKSLSEHFNNSIPAFYFTIHKGQSGGGSHYHFKVAEEIDNDEVSFTVNPYTITNHEESVNEFKGKLEEFKSKFKQSGGKKGKKSSKKSSKSRKSKRDNDSSDFDVSSDDIYSRVQRQVPVNQPIYYWWYDPYVYKLDSVFIPSFYQYTAPLLLNLNLKWSTNT